MKLSSKIAAIGSVAAFIASPLVQADGGNEAEAPVEITEPDQAVEEPADCGEGVVVPEDQVVDGSDGSEGVVVTEVTVEPGDGEVVEITGDSTEPPADGGAGGEVDPAVCGVPLDWVKRGGEELEDPNVIFYNMADGGALPTTAEGGESPMFKGNVELGQDEKGSAIEAKAGVVAPRIQREKKGPVALVKKGRVFLR
jgi:hypothetical protein